MKRRTFLRSAGALALSTGLGFGAEKQTIAEAFDREMEVFMEARKVPGGALAVVKNRRLVYAKGYGWADRDAKVPVQADSLFRIASLSKPITAVAVMQLIEKGKLKMEQAALEVLAPDLCKGGNAAVDERVRRITVRQLLEHTGGWDRDKSYDPMFRCKMIAEKQGVPCPPGPKDIICYMLGQPLDFDPGSRYAYSNFGYLLLGRIIERLSGLTYEEYMKKHVLAPLGITRMRLGESRRSGPGEVTYYTAEGETTKSVFDQTKVPWPYGGFNLEAMDAHGGWVASAIDLARFSAGLDDPSACPVLQSSTLSQMYERPPAPVGRNKDGTPAPTYYGCGWSVRPIASRGKANYWHNGSLPGTASILVRRWDGLSWAVLFNQRSEDKKLADSAIDPALHRAADTVGSWPTEDLFSQYG